MYWVHYQHHLSGVCVCHLRKRTRDQGYHTTRTVVPIFFNFFRLRPHHFKTWYTFQNTQNIRIRNRLTSDSYVRRQKNVLDSPIHLGMTLVLTFSGSRDRSVPQVQSCEASVCCLLVNPTGFPRRKTQNLKRITTNLSLERGICHGESWHITLVSGRIPVSVIPRNIWKYSEGTQNRNRNTTGT